VVVIAYAVITAMPIYQFPVAKWQQKCGLILTVVWKKKHFFACHYTLWQRAVGIPLESITIP
jgi:hypothetical protein